MGNGFQGNCELRITILLYIVNEFIDLGASADSIVYRHFFSPSHSDMKRRRLGKDMRLAGGHSKIVFHLKTNGPHA
jgi:hypothetical protein